MPNSTPILQLNNEQITFQNEAKCVGVTFDQHLTWAPPISHLVNSSQHGINLLRDISSTDWGADKQTLHKYIQNSYTSQTGLSISSLPHPICLKLQQTKLNPI